MDTNVPYMASVKNLAKILDAMAKAHVPPTFTLDFLKNLDFKSSNDRTIIPVLRYLGMIDASNQPTSVYRSFADPTRSRVILAGCLRSAYDELFTAHPDADSHTPTRLAGWFKSRTGKSEAVAQKIATTFKGLCSYADFSETEVVAEPAEAPAQDSTRSVETPGADTAVPLGLTYRIEIHLPDTTDLNTFRAIFRALREELTH